MALPFKLPEASVFHYPINLEISQHPALVCELFQHGSLTVQSYFLFDLPY